MIILRSRVVCMVHRDFTRQHFEYFGVPRSLRTNQSAAPSTRNSRPSMQGIVCRLLVVLTRHPAFNGRRQILLRIKPHMLFPGHCFEANLLQVFWNGSSLDSDPRARSQLTYGSASDPTGSHVWAPSITPVGVRSSVGFRLNSRASLDGAKQLTRREALTNDCVRVGRRRSDVERRAATG